jgi:glutaredoxin
MDDDQREILLAFDRAGVRELALAELSDSVTPDIISDMVKSGWLRGGDTAGAFCRTEDGRLQLARPLDVTIYSRPGCHLCEEAKIQVAPLLQEMGARLMEINIDEDAQLRARYDYDVPVIFIGARMAAKHRVNLGQFRRQMYDALHS